MADDLDVLWPDADLESVSVSYDECRIEVRESTGRRVAITGRGPIGYQLVGFWDEAVIESGTIASAHPFAEHCLREIENRLGSPPPESGSPGRNGGAFTTLVLSLIDGAQLICTAATFTVTSMNE